MAWLESPALHAAPLIWGLFALMVPAALISDLRLGQGSDGPPTPKMALWRTAGFAGVALAFAAALHVFGGAAGPAHSVAFGTLFVIEFALSVDNLFVFLLIFQSFDVQPKQAQRVLTWGILGALVLRGLMIALGASLLGHFTWLFYVLGAFLALTGLRLLVAGGHAEAPGPAPTPRWARMLPMASAEARAQAPAQAFWVREGGRWRATPLFVVLLAIEAADVVFALDSVPASFAISSDVVLIFGANIWAILGLRALYFALAHALGELRYLKPGLAVILMMIGAKMILKAHVEVPDLPFLGAIVAVLAAAFAASWWAPAKARSAP
jgi:tellurite resistance protein TerC